MKKILCSIFVATLMFSIFLPFQKVKAMPQSSALVETETFLEVAKTKTHSLWVDTKNASFRIVERKSNRVWDSNPSLYSDEFYSEDEFLMNQLTVSFIDELRNVATVGSYAESVSVGKHSIRRVRENDVAVGVKITYDFAKDSMKFKIPLKVTLHDDYFSAEILFDEIEEYGKSLVCNIGLLPNFSSGTHSDDGYLLIPDGSGALINLKDSYRAAPDYLEKVYGDDASMNVSLKKSNIGYGIRLPVFGAKVNDQGFVAVIHKADEIASITANSNRWMSDYSSVSAQFSYRENDQAGIANKDTMVRTVRMADSVPSSVSPEVRYYFLTEKDADYSGMARKAQKYLVERYDLSLLEKDSFQSVTLELFGGVTSSERFLGFHYNKLIKATTFEQATEILKTLNSQGVTNISTILYGFGKGGYQAKQNKVSFERKLGGKKGFIEFTSVADAPVYTAYEAVRQYQGSTDLFKGKKYIRGLNSLTIVREQGTLSTGSWNGSSKWLLSSASHLKKQVSKMLKSLRFTDNQGLLYSSMGNEIYNDFSPENPVDRSQMATVYQKLLEKTKFKTNHVAAEGGNMYLLSDVTQIIEAPSSSSGQQIFSKDVPFYSMVLHGYVQMSGEDANSAVKPYEITVKNIAFGLIPTFRVTYSESEKLAKTKLNFLYNTKFEDQKDEIVKAGNTYSNLYKNLVNVTIDSHKYVDSLSVTTYSDGSVIATNLSDKKVSYENKEILPYESILIANS